MKYSFIIPYYKRPSLKNTLWSLRHFYSDRTDWEVLVLEDKKNVGDSEAHAELTSILLGFQDLPLRHLEMEYDNYACVCAMTNHGVDVALGEYMVITSAECMHVTDVLSGLDSEFKRNPDAYVVCGTLSRVVSGEVDLKALNRIPRDPRWYQHSVYAPRFLYFCAAVSKKNFMEVGGINEEFDVGIGRADVEFTKRLIQKCPAVTRDDLLVIHQHHDYGFPQARRKELLRANNEVNKFSSRFRKD